MQMIASHLQEEDEQAPASFLSSFWGVKNCFSPPVAPLLSSPLRGTTMFADFVWNAVRIYFSVLQQQNFDSKHLPSISPPRLQPIHMESSVVRVCASCGGEVIHILLQTPSLWQQRKRALLQFAGVGSRHGWQSV